MAFLPNKWRHNSIKQRNDDQCSIHPVPVIREITMMAIEKTKTNGFHDHLHSEDNSEDMVHGCEDPPLCGPGGDGWPLHGQGDAISSNEN